MTKIECRHRLARALEIIISGAANIENYTSAMGKAAFANDSTRVDYFWDKLDSSQDQLTEGIDALRELLWDMDSENIQCKEACTKLLMEIMKNFE